MARYFDADYDWEEAAARRQARCCGADAPQLAPEEVVTQLTKAETLATSWEDHYKRHENRFFKARAYLSGAFPMLETVKLKPEKSFHAIELGCGTGSSIVPLLKAYENLSATVVDVSQTAIETLNSSLEAENLTARCSASVADVVLHELPARPDSCDFALLVFTLSAITPDHHVDVLRKAATSLVSGGFLLLRDYGLYDMVQERCDTRVGDCQYIKQDGIQCFFFSVENVTALAAAVGDLEIVEVKYCTVRNRNRKTGKQIDRVFLNAVLQKR